MTFQDKLKQEAAAATGAKIPFEVRQGHLKFWRQLQPLIYAHPVVSDGWWGEILGLKREQVNYIRNKKE